MILALVSFASAQAVPVPAVDAQLYRMPVDATSTMWADDSHLAPGISGRLAVDYVKQPFVWIWKDTGERVAVVDDALGIDAIAGFAAWRVRGAVDVPLYALATGDVLSGGGLGDIAVALKGAVLDREAAALGVALTGRVTFPTATTPLPLGNDGVGWELGAVVDKRFGNLVAVANLGTRGVPDVTLENVAVSDVFLYRVGAGYGFGDATAPRAGVSLDLAGQLSYEDPGNAAARSMEAMLGGWYQVSAPLSLRAGLGRGIGGGIGSPAARAVLAVAWQPVPKAAAAKPAEPRAKAPTQAAASDATPRSAASRPASDFLVVPGPATVPPGIVHIKVEDPQGKPLDATWSFGTVASGPIAHGLGMAKVPAGPWSILVSAPGYGTQSLSIDVDSGMTSHLEAHLAPARVRLTATNVELLEKLVWDRTVMHPESRVVLDEVAATLRAHPEILGVRVEGHTDSRGPAEENLTLSGARAATVVAYLVDQGLDPNRFVVAGYGETRPLDWAENPSAWARNERIELVITERAP
jgi:hypothetical protein